MGRGLSRAAVSVTFDLGFEEGGGVTAFRGKHDPGSCTDDDPCEQSFLSAMGYALAEVKVSGCTDSPQRAVSKDAVDPELVANHAPGEQLDRCSVS